MIKKTFLLASFTLILLSCEKKQTEKVVVEEQDIQIVDTLNNNSNTSFPTIDGSTSQNALDVVGTYKGTIPCADCEGIDISIVLGKGDTFTFTSKYLGGKDLNQSTEIKGNYTWNKEGAIINLKGEGVQQLLKVEENQLVWLGEDGKPNTGNLASKYILKKQ